MNKRLLSLTLIVCLSFCSCSAKPQLRRNYKRVSMDSLNAISENSTIDFSELSDDVMTDMLSMRDTFFYVVDNGFTITGSNDTKEINVDIQVIDETEKIQVELFFSMVLNYIGSYSAQQNFKYVPPTLGNDHAFKDFGTVFNDYDLNLHAEDINKKVIFDAHIKAGDKIPVDPEFVEED